MEAAEDGTKRKLMPGRKPGGVYVWSRRGMPVAKSRNSKKQKHDACHHAEVIG